MFSLNPVLYWLYWLEGFLFNGGVLIVPHAAIFCISAFFVFYFVFPATKFVISYLLFSKFHKEELKWLFDSLVKEGHVKQNLWGKMRAAAIAKKLCSRKVMSDYYKFTGVKSWNSKIDWRIVILAFVGGIKKGENLYDSFNNFVRSLCPRR